MTETAGTKGDFPGLGEVFGPSHADGGPELVQLLTPEGERVEHPDFSFDPTTGATITTQGFNFVGVNESAEAPFPAPTVPAAQNINGDFVGILSAPLDPLLQRLANNGGPTRTRLPQTGSPVIDQGDCTAAARSA